MTSNRLRKHPAYEKGRSLADGIEPDGVQWINSPDGERAFRAGYYDRCKEVEQHKELTRLANTDLSLLLQEARYERDFDKLCAVVERLIKQ